MSTMMGQISAQIVGIEYGFTKPQSLIVCIPLVAQLVQHVQLNQIPRPSNSSEMPAHVEKVDLINTCHALGALIRSVAWVALAFFTGNPLFVLCAIPALYQAYHSSRNLVHSYQSHLPGQDINSNGQSVDRLAVAPVNAPNSPAEAGGLSLIGNALLRAFAPAEISPQRVNAMLTRAMDEIKEALLRQTHYPNKTLIGIRIEARDAQPFIGGMNLNLTEAPRDLVWHEALYQRMQEYLTRNQVTKFEIVLGIGTCPKTGRYNIQLMDKSLELKEGGTSSGFTYASYDGVSDAGIRCIIQCYPALLSTLDHMEDVFANHTLPSAE